MTSELQNITRYIPISIVTSNYERLYAPLRGCLVHLISNQGVNSRLIGARSIKRTEI
jgi:hypothetical protein